MTPELKLEASTFAQAWARYSDQRGRISVCMNALLLDNDRLTAELEVAASRALAAEQALAAKDTAPTTVVRLRDQDPMPLEDFIKLVTRAAIESLTNNATAIITGNHVEIVSKHSKNYEISKES